MPMHQPQLYASFACCQLLLTTPSGGVLLPSHYIDKDTQARESQLAAIHAEFPSPLMLTLQVSKRRPGGEEPREGTLGSYHNSYTYQSLWNLRPVSIHDHSFLRRQRPFINSCNIPSLPSRIVRPSLQWALVAQDFTPFSSLPFPTSSSPSSTTEEFRERNHAWEPSG